MVEQSETENFQFIVSVVIPAYNCEDTLGRAIQSIADQSVSVKEIIVVDDGSSDKTVETVRQLSKTFKKLRLIEQANGGPAKARNAGIEIAQGNWVAFLDADDAWLPNRVELQHKILERHPNLAWLSGAYTRVKPDANGQMIELGESSKSMRMKQGHDGVYDALEEMVNGTSIWTGSMLIRRKELMALGGFECEIKGSEDIDLWVRLAMLYPKIGFVTQTIARYTVDQADSIVGGNARNLDLTKFVFYKRIADLVERSDGVTKKRLEKLLGQKIQIYTNSLVRTGELDNARQFIGMLKRDGLPLPSLKSQIYTFIPKQIFNRIRSFMLARRKKP